MKPYTHKKDLRTRLLEKVIIDENSCWVWKGSRFHKKQGDYGQIRIGGRKNNKLRRAHVVSYEVFVGLVEHGLELDHICRNTLCINPDHLKAVSHIENCRRRKDSGLKNCKYGHEYTPESAYITPKGRRICRICKKISNERWYKKKISGGKIK